MIKMCSIFLVGRKQISFREIGEDMIKQVFLKVIGEDNNQKIFPRELIKKVCKTANFSGLQH